MRLVAKWVVAGHVFRAGVLPSLHQAKVRSSQLAQSLFTQLQFTTAHTTPRFRIKRSIGTPQHTMAVNTVKIAIGSSSQSPKRKVESYLDLSGKSAKRSRSQCGGTPSLTDASNARPMPEVPSRKPVCHSDIFS
jgi:hypothetical protein